MKRKEMDNKIAIRIQSKLHFQNVTYLESVQFQLNLTSDGTETALT